MTPMMFNLAIVLGCFWVMMFVKFIFGCYALR